jgi:hypothetical protein
MNITDFFRDPKRCKTVVEMFSEKCNKRNQLIAEGITSKNKPQYDELNKWLIENCERYLKARNTH